MKFKIIVLVLSGLIVILFYDAFFKKEMPEIMVVTPKDKDLIIENRLFSPNRKNVVFSYKFDHGALGYSRVFHSLAISKDTISNINQHLLRQIGEFQFLYPIKWESDSVLITSAKYSDFTNRGVSIATNKLIWKKEFSNWQGVIIQENYFQFLK
ncbi:hypothetical protein [Lacihabitans soyangensis]|uniref:Uncharacterized protein n=1 Tax=Lacihabitans soyangensis TaxID=869394 RepID=A0AAE3KXZ2_9BACT|nr:hypothetical protein [Lacihabitans soyangensis]MCP9766150.1 hypothetical protein [Lacihabitans soyangensis]